MFGFCAGGNGATKRRVMLSLIYFNIFLRYFFADFILDILYGTLKIFFDKKVDFVFCSALCSLKHARPAPPESKLVKCATLKCFP